MTILKNVVFSKLFSNEDVNKVLEAIGGASKVLFVDTPPTTFLVQIIKDLVQKGIEVVLRDHHDVDEIRSSRDGETRAAVEELRKVLPSAVISNRKANPACAALVGVGEFADEATFIVADPDLDGLTAALKARGIIYPELDQDSGVLDGAPSGRTPETLSPMGLLMDRAMATLPGFSSPSFQEERTKIFFLIADAIGGDEKALHSLTDKVKIYEEQVVSAKKLAETAIEVVPSVQFVDATNWPRYDLGTLSAAMEARPGCRVTAILKKDGPIAKVHGTQVSLAVKKQHQGDVNLQDYLPDGFVSAPESGIISNTTFLLHLSPEKFEEFLKKFKA